ncbi:MAG: hypothetical protein V3W34_14130 [Phycisphaerae bacterium]
MSEDNEAVRVWGTMAETIKAEQFLDPQSPVGRRELMARIITCGRYHDPVISHKCRACLLGLIKVHWNTFVETMPDEYRESLAERAMWDAVLDPDSGLTDWHRVEFLLTVVEAATAVSATLQRPAGSECDQPILHIDEKNYTVELDGTTHPLSPDQFTMVGAIVKAGGGFVATKEMGFPKGVRADRLLGRMPQEIRDHIKSKPGAGYRLT